MRFILPIMLAVSLTACSGKTDQVEDCIDAPTDVVQNENVASEPAKTYSPKFSELGAGEYVNYTGRDLYRHVHTDDLPSGIALTEEIIPPKTLGAPPHIHEDEDEIFIVLSGTVHFLNGEDEVVGKAGTVASLPRGYYHGFWNPYDEPANLLLVIAPGHFEDFFTDVEAALAEGGPKSPPEIGAIIAEKAAERNVTIDMSKLPASGLALLGPPPE